MEVIFVATQLYIVSPQDVFSYLKTCLYTESIVEVRRAGKEIRSGIFYETVRMIEKLEEGLAKIEDNIISNQIAYEDSDDDAKEEIIRFLNQLRLDEELILYAENANARFSIQVSLFFRIVAEEFPVFYIDGDDWTKYDLPLEQIFACIAKYRYELKSRYKINKDELLECNQRHISFVKIFNKIIKRAKKVYVLNLMIEISPNFLIGQSLWDKKAVEDVLHALGGSYKEIVTQLYGYAHFVNTFMGVNESLNFHLVFILKHDVVFDSKEVAEQIKRILNQHLNKRNDYNPLNKYEITVKNLNERIKHQFKQRTVTDVLGCRPKKQLEDFNFWYLYLFTYSTFFISTDREKFKYTSFDIYDLGYKISELFYEIKKLGPEYRPAYSKEPIKESSLISLYGELEGDRTWAKALYRLDNKKEYLGLCHIYDEQKHFFPFERNSSERLKYLELFIQYLKQEKIPAISNIDKELEHIIRFPERNLSLSEKLALIVLLDHELNQSNKDNLAKILKSTLSPNIEVFLKEFKNDRNVNKLLSYKVFSFAFYRHLHKFICDFKNKLHECDIAIEQVKRSAKREKNDKSINQYLRYQFKQNVDVYRLKMTCKIDIQEIPEALLITVFSEIWTTFIKDVKRKPNIIGQLLVAHVGVYVSLIEPIIDVTLIFNSENIGDLEFSTPDKINETWRNYLTEETKSQLIRKLQKREININQAENTVAVDYEGLLNNLILESTEIPLVMEKRNRQGDYSLCDYKDKKYKLKFIRLLAKYYSNYSLMKRGSIKGSEKNLNLLLKGRLIQPIQQNIPKRIKPVIDESEDS